MTNKHTPGPWLVAGEDKTFVYALGPSGTNSFWAQVRYVGIDRISKDEAIANASLISAAPDMLEALYAVIRVADRKTDEFDAARAAIAKATGQALQELADIGQELNI